MIFLILALVVQNEHGIMHAHDYSGMDGLLVQIWPLGVKAKDHTFCSYLTVGDRKPLPYTTSEKSLKQHTCYDKEWKCTGWTIVNK